MVILGCAGVPAGSTLWLNCKRRRASARGPGWSKVALSQRQVTSAVGWSATLRGMKESTVLRLRPTLVYRLLNALGPALLVAVVVPLLIDLGAGYDTVGILLSLLAPSGVYRGARLGVDLRHDRMLVRNFLRNRTILRSSVIAVSDHPRVTWQDGASRRSTVVSAFAKNPHGRWDINPRRHRERMIETLQEYVHIGLPGI